MVRPDPLIPMKERYIDGKVAKERYRLYRQTLHE
jgi:hypothetical protein